VWLIWPCIDEWTLARMMLMFWCTYFYMSICYYDYVIHVSCRFVDIADKVSSLSYAKVS